MSGFGNEFQTEALDGALPQGRNSPQRCAYGLYAEQLSGTPFTAPRASNARGWLYRILPSVRHIARFRPLETPLWKTAPHAVDHGLPLGPLRWDPTPIPNESLTFVSGMRTMTTAGDVFAQTGMAAHVYLMTTGMTDEAFCNADGDLLIVPEQGGVRVFTELGMLEAAPGEIVLVPRGMIFKASPLDREARGYVCENYGRRFALPDLGPIGANGLANPNDFLAPVAAYEDLESPHRLIMKWCGGFHVADIPRSPLDVVAWRGNYAPYKYDLRRFSTIGSISIDHPDPSIFTVLTSPLGEPGTANVDFVIFPERWMVAEDTFRPPYYHRNLMSEFMGLIYGVYDAKPEGFVPGGMSLHNAMLPHGPDNSAFEAASAADLKPHKLSGTLAFMFETRLPQQLTRYAAELPTLQAGYADCWSGLTKRFDPAQRERGAA
jgi:homogentisate 1,2-dioxygenase